MSQAPTENPGVSPKSFETGTLPDGSEFQYHKVTEETKGTVNVAGGTRDVDAGNYLIPGPSGDVFTVLDEEEFNNLGQQPQTDETSTEEEETEGDHEVEITSSDQETPFRS